MSGGEKGRGRMGLESICTASLERVTRNGYLGGEGAGKRRMEAGIVALLKEKRASSRGSGQSGESGESHVSNTMLLLLLGASGKGQVGGDGKRAQIEVETGLRYKIRWEQMM